MPIEGGRLNFSPHTAAAFELSLQGPLSRNEYGAARIASAQSHTYLFDMSAEQSMTVADMWLSAFQKVHTGRNTEAIGEFTSYYEAIQIKTATDFNPSALA